MYYLISVLIIIASFLLVLIVLVQNSKGGGLASGFSSSNQVMGVRKTADFLEKATWTLAVSLLVLTVLATAFIPKGEVDETRSIIEDQIEQAIDPNAIPNLPVTTPTDNSGEEE